jgi:hypothetical protein
LISGKTSQLPAKNTNKDWMVKLFKGDMFKTGRFKRKRIFKFVSTYLPMPAKRFTHLTFLHLISSFS